MKLFQFWSQEVAGSAVQVGEHQQDRSSTKFLERKFAVTIQARQPKIGCSRSSLQSIPLDLAPGERALAEARGAAVNFVLGISNFRLAIR